MPDSKIAPLIDYGAAEKPWYAEVTRYQWLVLVIASAGWIFDTYENQVFNITRQPLLKELLQPGASASYYGEVLLAIFLVGGATGGILFGVIADRWGRGLSMILTILMYAVFSGLTFFAQNIWQVAVLRFFVAIGTGGEWAVAAALVAEVFPARARANGSAIFHASSVLGTWFATLAGMLVNSHWRYAYLIGILPALLVVWIRTSIREPEKWQRAHADAEAEGLSQRRPSGGSLASLVSDSVLRRRAVLGLLLAAVGLAGYWGVFVGAQDLTQEMLGKSGLSIDDARRKAQFAYGFIANLGAGLGLLAMGPLCNRIGRRPAFAVFLLGAIIITPIVCYLPKNYTQMLLLLPLFGFFNVGLHAGYAVYFPELFPTRLRATGSGLCFNGGRVVAASMLWFSGWLKSRVDLRLAVSLLALVYLFGFVFAALLPETRGRPLEE